MSWSLAIEDQFYLLFPLAVYFMPKKRLITLVIASLFIAPVFRDVFLKIFGDWYAAYVLLPSRMDGIMYGVVLALILRSKKAFNFVSHYRVVLDLIALFFLYIITMNFTPSWWPRMMDTIFPLKQSVISIMWAIAILRVYTYKNSIFNKIWCNRLLIKTGMISYGLYMYHQTINGLIHGILFNQEPCIATLNNLLAALSVIIISIGLATVSYFFFERPIQRYGRVVVARLSEEKVLPSSSMAT
ncbi:hypothetical protein HBNCFIEN_01090 [Legionella sp. PC997]|nr:hypothetical protein HBNCFIEN_01090 [Legionella sp. PC997]